MCARYTVTEKEVKKIAKRFKVEKIQEEFDFKPRFNVCPTQTAPAITVQSGQRYLANFYFGLVPVWAKDMKIGGKLCQARSDTILERPSYKKPFLEKRCLIPVNGYYEWQEIEGENSRPHYFYRDDDDLFAIGGIWSVWKDPEGKDVYSYAIITADADNGVNSIHHRMPLIVPDKLHDAWLDPNLKDPDKLTPMLKSSSQGIRYHRVSTIVNSPKNYDERCIAPLAA
jgi:putative SOS response-associated peptidase YedK